MVMQTLIRKGLFLLGPHFFYGRRASSTTRRFPVLSDLGTTSPFPICRPPGLGVFPRVLIRVLAFPPVADATELNVYVFAGKCLTWHNSGYYYFRFPLASSKYPVKFPGK